MAIQKGKGFVSWHNGRLGFLGCAYGVLQGMDVPQLKQSQIQADVGRQQRF